MLKSFKNFGLLFQQATEKGLLLLFFTLLAMILNNSSYKDSYKVISQFSYHLFDLPLIVNDLLMAIFFLLVGIEIKREWYTGHLSSWKQRILPLICACSGVIAPALIFTYINYDITENLSGWAIPTATDIAFALAIFSVCSKGLSSSLRVFLVALAVIDDLIAIVIIACAYSQNINYLYLLLMFGVVILINNMDKLKSPSIWIYIMFFPILWYVTFKSGIHATVSGVLLGFSIPIHRSENNITTISSRQIELIISPLISYFILPLFAFINSGIDFSSDIGFFNRVTLGVALGLIIGKQLGIFGTMYLLTKARIASMPESSNYFEFYGVSILCGVGFTMSIFVSLLAYPADNIMLAKAQLGIVAGSLISALMGSIILAVYKKRR